MPQDAYTISFIAEELESLLLSAKISKIIQPQKETLVFYIYTSKGTVKLEICLSAKGCRMSLTDREVAAPQVAPGFCMLLRKHLQNAQITALKQVKGERIIYIDLDCTSEFELVKMRLYVELMGKYSNAVLTENGAILGALKTNSLGDEAKRLLFPGIKYALPEPQDKTAPDDLKALEKVFERIGGDGAKFIADNVLGVAYTTALDIVAEYGEKPCAKEVYGYLRGGKKQPCVTISDGKPDDFKARSAKTDKILYGSVLEAQTAYYDYVVSKQEFENYSKRLDGAVASAVKKLEKRLAVMETKLFDCRDTDEVKLKGELITANIYAVRRGAEFLEAVNYYDENRQKIKIRLDKTLSPAENAQRYYKKYAKLKRTFEAVSAQKTETEQSLDYLNSIRSHICAAETPTDLRETEEELKALGLIKETKTTKKKPVTAPFREYEYGGFKIVAGRNNVQNDRLLKSLSPQDMWLHTQAYHSSHVAVLSRGGKIPDEVLKTAAEICAYYSDGRGGGKIPVDYTERRFVRKPPKAQAGFVTYTDYRTLLVQPDAHNGEKTENYEK